MRFRNILESDFYKKLPQQGAEVAKNAGKWVADNPLKSLTSLTGVGAVALAHQIMTNQLTFGFVCPVELSEDDQLDIRVQIMQYCSPLWNFAAAVKSIRESKDGMTPSAAVVMSAHLEMRTPIKVSFEECSFGTKVIVNVKKGAFGTAILLFIKRSDVYEADDLKMISAMLPKNIIEKIEKAGKTKYRTFWFERQRENIRFYVFPNSQKEETKLPEGKLKSVFVRGLDDFKKNNSIPDNVLTEKLVSVKKRERGGVVVRVTHNGLGENEEMQKKVHDKLLQSAFYPDSEPALTTTPAGVSGSSEGASDTGL